MKYSLNTWKLELSIKEFCSQFTFDRWNLEKLLGGSLTNFFLHYSYITVDIQRTVEACAIIKGDRCVKKLVQ